MSQNFDNTSTPTTGGAGTGATDAGTTRDTSTGGAFGTGSGSTGGGSSSTGGGSGSTGLTTGGSTGTGSTGTATAPAREGLAGTAQE
ncbi:MAG: hypothetical protein LC800_06305, partial [Acidobacteria bacterium]|nr:hypothetical protein [Acidobacteriota bacterium]